MMYHRSVRLLQSLREPVRVAFLNLTSVASTQKMVRSVTVEGYEALNSVLKAETGKVFILFSGSPNEQGVSWCPDCVKADPVIERNLEKAPSDALFIHCHVGDRTYWKNQNNEFRKDPRFAIRCVPTLLRFGSVIFIEHGYHHKRSSLLLRSYAENIITVHQLVNTASQIGRGAVPK